MQLAKKTQAKVTAKQGRNPLTGLSGLQLEGRKAVATFKIWPSSQSPYGARWFATHIGRQQQCCGLENCRNPLTGLCGLQRLEDALEYAKDIPEVAIPLRGYVVCNSTPLRMPF